MSGLLEAVSRWTYPMLIRRDTHGKPIVVLTHRRAYMAPDEESARRLRRRLTLLVWMSVVVVGAAMPAIWQQASRPALFSLVLIAPALGLLVSWLLLPVMLLWLRGWEPTDARLAASAQVEGSAGGLGSFVGFLFGLFLTGTTLVLADRVGFGRGVVVFFAVCSLSLLIFFGNRIRISACHSSAK
jgi:hypothetical protein